MKRVTIAFEKLSTRMSHNHKTCSRAVFVFGEVSGEEIKHFLQSIIRSFMKMVIHRKSQYTEVYNIYKSLCRTCG